MDKKGTIVIVLMTVFFAVAIIGKKIVHSDIMTYLGLAAFVICAIIYGFVGFKKK